MRLRSRPPCSRKHPPHRNFGRAAIYDRIITVGFMTELLYSNVSSVTCGAAHEFGMAGAVRFPGLVKSPSLVVESADAGQRSKYRGLVLAVPPAPRTADRRFRH